MFTLEVPARSPRPKLIDPYYAQRAALVEAMINGKPVVSAPPIKIGRIAAKKRFSQPTQAREEDWHDALHIEVRQGEARVSCRTDLSQYAEPLSKIISHEASLYGSSIKGNGEISLTRSSVAEGGIQRVIRGEDWAHRDDEEGWVHIHTVCDLNPTDSYVFGPKHPIQRTIRRGYRAYGRSAKVESLLPIGDGAVARTKTAGEPYDIMFANSTTYHASPVFPEDGVRTFMRVVVAHSL